MMIEGASPIFFRGAGGHQTGHTAAYEGRYVKRWPFNALMARLGLRRRSSHAAAIL